MGRAYWKYASCGVHLMTPSCAKSSDHVVNGPEILDNPPEDLRVPQPATTRKTANIVRDLTIVAPTGADAFYREATGFAGW